MASCSLEIVMVLENISLSPLLSLSWYKPFFLTLKCLTPKRPHTIMKRLVIFFCKDVTIKQITPFDQCESIQGGFSL